MAVTALEANEFVDASSSEPSAASPSSEEEVDDRNEDEDTLAAESRFPSRNNFLGCNNSVGDLLDDDRAITGFVSDDDIFVATVFVGVTDDDEEKAVNDDSIACEGKNQRTALATTAAAGGNDTWKGRPLTERGILIGTKTLSRRREFGAEDEGRWGDGPEGGRSANDER